MTLLEFFKFVNMRKLFCGIVALFMTLSLSAHTGIPWDNSEGESGTNRDTLLPKPGFVLFVEGIGKGYFSFNADFPYSVSSQTQYRIHSDGL